MNYQNLKNSFIMGIPYTNLVAIAAGKQVTGEYSPPLNQLAQQYDIPTAHLEDLLSKVRLQDINKLISETDG